MVKCPAHAAFNSLRLSPFIAEHKPTQRPLFDLPLAFAQQELDVMLEDDPRGEVNAQQGSSGVQKIAEKHIETLATEQRFHRPLELGSVALCQEIRKAAELA